MEQLTQTKCPVLLKVVLVCAVTLQISCHHQSYSSPEGYDMRAPQKMDLGKVLNEISGITYNTDNNTLLAISDSKEKVFELNVNKPKLKDYTDKVVGPNSDLEDIVKLCFWIIAKRDPETSRAGVFCAAVGRNVDLWLVTRDLPAERRLLRGYNSALETGISHRSGLRVRVDAHLSEELE